MAMRGSSVLKRLILRLEALCWMTRPSSVVTGLIAVPGWLVATSPPRFGRLAAMVGAVMVGRMIVNVINDILDEEKDRVTAPELPLPSGLVTLPQAALTAGALTICLLVLLAIAGGSWVGFSVGAGGIALGGLFIGSYSFVKPHALVAMAVTGGAFLSGSLTAWLVAGGGWSAAVAIVLAYALLRGLAGNVFSTLRDVELDAEVGNHSIAVRLGASRALTLGLAIEVLAVVCVLSLALVRHRLLVGAIVVTASVTLFVLGYMATARMQRSAVGRHERASVALPINVARNYVAIILVESVPIGLAAAAVTALGIVLDVVPFYDRRIFGGGLREALATAGQRGDRRTSASTG
jgi:4-hydroxybenzoate polyprenyltransferase